MHVTHVSPSAEMRTVPSLRETWTLLKVVFVRVWSSKKSREKPEGMQEIDSGASSAAAPKPIVRSHFAFTEK